MRALRCLYLTILSISLGASVLLYAQDDKPQQDKPQQQQEPQQEPKAHPDEPKHQDAAKPAQQDEAKPSKQEKQDEKQAEKQMKQQQKENNQGQPGRPMQAQQGGNARPAGKGGHIPDNQFHAHFGRSHTFRAQTVIVAGQPQFQYSGYSFELVDAWPADWAYTDDCYIDYIDGEYFLFDLLHPGIRIAVFVVM
jgi:hypothetical protein